MVVSWQYRIDAEASLKGVEARLNDTPQSTAANTAPRHEGEAKIDAIGPDTFTLSHGPIPSLKWGTMTMDFKRPQPSALTRNLAVGDRITFEFYMGTEGPPQLTRVSPMPAQQQVQVARK